MFWLKPTSLVVMLLCLTTAACDNAAKITDPATQPPLVRVTRIGNAIDPSHTFTGVIASRIQSNLGFRVSGKIMERRVDSGQPVKQGQPLLLLDPQDLALQNSAQEQAVAAAAARVKQSTDDEARYRSLITTGAVSASAYDAARAQADSARAELHAAQAQALVTRNATQYSILRADADGVIVETLAEPGQVVAAGQTVIRLARAGQREAVVNLPEGLRPSPGSVAYAQRYGDPQTVVKATMRQLSDAADPMTRTFEARFVLAPPLSLAPLGSTVTLQIPDERLSAQLFRVPLAAIYDPGAGKGAGVWLASGTPLRVHWQPVTLHSLSNESACVSGNISHGMTVVALGAHLLHEGEVIRADAADASRVQGE